MWLWFSNASCYALHTARQIYPVCAVATEESIGHNIYLQFGLGHILPQQLKMYLEDTGTETHALLLLNNTSSQPFILAIRHTSSPQRKWQFFVQTPYLSCSSGHHKVLSKLAKMSMPFSMDPYTYNSQLH